MQAGHLPRESPGHPCNLPMRVPLARGRAPLQPHGRGRAAWHVDAPSTVVIPPGAAQCLPVSAHMGKPRPQSSRCSCDTRPFPMHPTKCKPATQSTAHRPRPLRLLRVETAAWTRALPYALSSCRDRVEVRTVSEGPTAAGTRCWKVLSMAWASRLIFWEQALRSTPWSRFCGLSTCARYSRTT